jgi:hypothetical protein
MAAGLGFKTFNTGDVLSAADTNGYLMQGVLVFANAAARDAAITSPQEGQCCYLKDTDAVQTYSGAAWVGFDDSNAIQNSIVDAKGDIVTASGNDTPARLAVGNNGDTLVADSSTATGLAYREDYAAGKNKIINGAFDVWQRGTSFAGLTTSTYTADRWRYNPSGATATISRQTFTAGTAPVAGYESQFFLRMDVTVAEDNAGIVQFIEDVRTFAAQTVTVSFWAKADTNRTMQPVISQNFGSGGSAAVNTLGTNISITSSWVRYSQTFTVPSISGKTIGTSSYLEINLRNPNNQTSTIDLWGVQVEDGSVATAFQTATGTLQGELAACQRYYQALSKFGCSGYASGSGESIMNTLPFLTAMRATPTVTITSNGTTSRLTSLAIQDTSTTSAILHVTASGAGFAGVYGATAGNAAIEL